MYGEGGKRWALTERGRGAVERTRSTLGIGPSSLSWDGNALTIEIDEVTAPVPSRIRGRVRVHPAALSDRAFTLDAERRHRWWPIAPSARVEVELERPCLRWTGNGYLDTNDGDAPLEASFTTWDWSRADLKRGAAILYDVNRHDGSEQSIAIRIDPAGHVTPFAPPPRTPLPRTGWRVARKTRVDPDHDAAVRQTLEDTPFYARSVLTSRLLGEPVVAMHESLDLDRFRAGWVQLMLPFRIPRRAR